MRIGIGRVVTPNELKLINALDLIIRGAGIGVIYIYWFNGGDTFGFSRNGKILVILLDFQKVRLREYYK